jgi:rifampicin phosphotransferase
MHMTVLTKRYVLGFDEIDGTLVADVGGKGAALGALSRLSGVDVPPGCCVTTAAARLAMAQEPAIDDRLAELAALEADGVAHDPDAIRALGAELRALVAAVPVPEDVAAELVDALAPFGPDAAWAVRSSATTEDAASASSAGQHDSWLDVVGPTAVLAHVSRCWASLHTDRAIADRLRRGIDPRQAQMAVVVQQMVPADAAGVLFTADPVTSNRKVAAVEAVRGLGDALVSGHVTPDVWSVRDDEVVGSATSPDPALTTEQVRRLVRLGRRIETDLGAPQDVEWCLVGDRFRIVQSRPITTLFPVPVRDDDDGHVYLSVGHQQMMTDPMKPLGLSMFRMVAGPPMWEAAGRLFVDVTGAMASPTIRPGLLDLLGRGDPLTRDALETVIARGDIVPSAVEGAPVEAAGPAPAGPVDTDPAIVRELVERTQASIATAAREIAPLTGPALVDFIRDDVVELRAVLFAPQSHDVVMAGMEATWWLDDHLREWLGVRGAADTLAQSVPGNVTSEMGLALLDVADVVRRHPDVVAALRVADDDRFLDELPAVAGGQEVQAAIRSYLDTYGMRCVGEIDITRPRWSEQPLALVPLILGDVAAFEPGEARRRFERGRREALDAEQSLLARLRELPDGEAKAAATRAAIERLRTFIGFREYPKFGKVCRFALYRRALLAEADRLVAAGVLDDRDDISFLTFDELADVVRTRVADRDRIAARREAFRVAAALTPPRVLTSDGELVSGSYHRDDLPPGALVGLPVSAGVVEGRARIVVDLADADVEPGDVLVTRFTDPSWSPLFVAVAGLVTEVGGQMTHGAVIAREYGLPAVVGVEGATQLIADGQRIRVDGTNGSVELLATASP